MRFFVLTAVLFAGSATAFPALARGSLRRGRATPGRRAAEPYSPQYPYTGATLTGLPGTGVGGVQVPAPGDTAHEYQDPPEGAYRGPCPGLNTAANHGFLSRDGITTYDELVAAQQNVYNAGYDLAVFLAATGIAADGDITTEKLSIGGDATSLTSPDGGATGQEGGLDSHDKFEMDTSLTRNDYYLANGDDYTFNGTLFGMMTSTVASTSSAADPLYNLAGLSLYRSQRYDQSKAENGNFYFSPREILLYGAATFLYELFPSSSNGNIPDEPTISSFFGAVASSTTPTTYSYVPERIPANWTNRATPYTLMEIGQQLMDMYNAYPKPFGANVGQGNFVPTANFSTIQNGVWNPQSASDVVCLMYQVAVENVPSEVSLSTEALAYVLGKLNPVFGPLGCPIVTPED